MRIDRQVERCNRILVARLRHCVSEQQKDGETYIQLLTFMYSWKARRAPETFPFHGKLHRKPVSGSTIDRLTWPKTICKETWHPDPCNLLQPIGLMRAALSSLLYTAQRPYKPDSDKNVRPERTFKIGNHVFVHRSFLASIALDAADEVANRQQQIIVPSVCTVHNIQCPTTYRNYWRRFVKHFLNCLSQAVTNTWTLDISANETTKILRSGNERQKRRNCLKIAEWWHKKWYHCTVGVCGEPYNG